MISFGLTTVKSKSEQTLFKLKWIAIHLLAPSQPDKGIDAAAISRIPSHPMLPMFQVTWEFEAIETHYENIGFESRLDTFVSAI